MEAMDGNSCQAGEKEVHMINVLLIEDHVIVRQGIQSILSHVRGIKVIAEANY